MVTTPTETAILDLLDEGLSEQQIVERGFPASKVRFTISTFGAATRNISSDRRRERAIRTASRQLAAAVQLAGGHC